jgi:hypothetical protein
LLTCSKVVDVGVITALRAMHLLGCMWALTARRLKDEGGFDCTAAQCGTKFKADKSEFTSVIDHNVSAPQLLSKPAIVNAL